MNILKKNTPRDNLYKLFVHDELNFSWKQLIILMETWRETLKFDIFFIVRTTDLEFEAGAILKYPEISRMCIFFFFVKSIKCLILIFQYSSLNFTNRFNAALNRSDSFRQSLILIIRHNHIKIQSLSSSRGILESKGDFKLCVYSQSSAWFFLKRIYLRKVASSASDTWIKKHTMKWIFQFWL